MHACCCTSVSSVVGVRGRGGLCTSLSQSRDFYQSQASMQQLVGFRRMPAATNPTAVPLAAPGGDAAAGAVRLGSAAARRCRSTCDSRRYVSRMPCAHPPPAPSGRPPSARAPPASTCMAPSAACTYDRWHGRLRVDTTAEEHSPYITRMHTPQGVHTRMHYDA